jgi:hypothetical protein
MKAFVLSILSSVIFLVLIGLLFHSEKRELPRAYVYPPTVITDCPKVNSAPAKPFDPNEKFRYVDLSFPQSDFKNRSYGQYRFSSGKTIDLKVTNGELEYDFEPQGSRGWFFLKDILFTDVTGDGTADVLIWLVHVECGLSCDGGRALFYIYTIRDEAWKEIWKYETGSYGYGCGLKSLTVLNKQLVLQMFGRCAEPENVDSEAEKFVATYSTISQFRFNGSRFVKRENEFVSVPKTEVMNFNAKIHIVE